MSKLNYPPHEILDKKDYEHIILWMLYNNEECEWADFTAGSVNISLSTLAYYIMRLEKRGYLERLKRGAYCITPSGKNWYNLLYSDVLFAEVNNIRICYKIQGNDPPVILLHGFGMHKDFWFAQTPSLSKHFKVITVDNRGSGKSDHPKEPYTIENLADDVKGLMDFLEIENAHLIGWATGGMIAQYVVLKYPQKVNKLILISTLTKLPVSKSGLEMFKNSQLAFHEAKLKDPRKAFYDKMKSRFTRSFFKLMENPKKKFHGLFTTEELMDIVFKDTSKPHDIINRINAIGGLNTLEELHKINNETLILTGEKDRITPKVSNIQIHERIPNSKLKIFEGGHYFPIEEAPEVNQVIIEFLNDKK